MGIDHASRESNEDTEEKYQLLKLMQLKNPVHKQRGCHYTDTEDCSSIVRENSDFKERDTFVADVWSYFSFIWDKEDNKILCSTHCNVN